MENLLPLGHSITVSSIEIFETIVGSHVVVRNNREGSFIH